MEEKITDGNSAAAEIAYKLSEVIPVYPITPSTPMAELVSSLNANNRTNIIGEKVEVIEMQSEAGVAGTLHGSLFAGAAASTFTSSQGLLLMIPNMYKIAGENLPCVLHVASRAIATHALNIFCDHSDVYAARSTGFNMLCSSSVQECQDMAFIAHAIALKGLGPTLHFFDGFRTSHELQKIKTLPDVMFEPLKKDILNFRKNQAQDPDQYGTAQNPDVYFQGRENSVLKHEKNLIQEIETIFDDFKKNTGRNYQPFEYYGVPDAENIVVAIGSSCNTIEEYIDQSKEKIGLIKVRLYRPFSYSSFVKTIPSTVKRICVLDRTNDSGSKEPLFLDVAASLQSNKSILLISGRYGLGGKDFTPSSVEAVFSNLKQSIPIDDFAVGVYTNDLTLPVLPLKPCIITKNDFEIKIFGLGSDGSVSASKSTVKVLGEKYDKFIQGYFEYDSKKSGSLTISHLRISDKKIKSTYLLQSSNVISINNFSFVHKYDCLDGLKEKGIVIINSIFDGQELDKVLPKNYVEKLKEKNAELFIINGHKIAKENGLGEKINIIMQAALFKASGILSNEEIIEKISQEIKLNFAKKGHKVVEKNLKALHQSITSLKKIDVNALHGKTYPPAQKKDNSFYNEIMNPIEKLQGDKIALELIEGKVPLGSSKYEKRAIASRLPKWIKENCIQCGQCVLACPHSALRAILANSEECDNKLFAKAIGLKDMLYKIQLSPEDCTGCGVCANTCPALKKALTMCEASEILDYEKKLYQYVNSLNQHDQNFFSTDYAKGLQFERPYFEFPAACAGCGETPYIKIASMLFKEKMIIANATGCSSIYSGTYGSCPFIADKEGKGIKWANSLFEDNAEFGLGIKLANSYTQNKDKSVWIIGGDGWAYDIGFSGLDHVLASGQNVNILVLDNQSYSNTGGQSSKSTPMGASVKLAENGKMTHKKDLGQIAMNYGNVYVAQIALGADITQTIKAFKEAESYNGVSLIIAYSPCVNQGFNLEFMTEETKKAVECGFWPLYRFDPRKNKLYLDSNMSEENYLDFLKRERRFQITVEKGQTNLLEEQKRKALSSFLALKTQSQNK